MNTNHISNWYERIFENNERLRIVNLRSNNINLLTTEMMEDLRVVKFLAIGANNFVCECSLREFINRARFNAQVNQCEGTPQRTKRDLPEVFYDPKYYYNVLIRQYHGYISKYEKSYKNIINKQDNVKKFDAKLELRKLVEVKPEADKCLDLKSNSTMNFEFLLLDYNENDYHCIDTSEGRKVHFYDIIPCPENSYQSTPTSGPIVGTRSTESENDVTEEDDKIYDEHPDINLKIPNTSADALLIIYLSVGIPLIFVGAMWFWKRKDIRYFCAIFRNSLILSFDNEDKKNLVMENQRKSNANDDQYRFDLFVSYSDKDRDFVLEQLIPNLEKRSQITICLHERDFQVGLSILENIIQCMDQSRCLLLVISESFLKSNWCSFEMHLAQHRFVFLKGFENVKITERRFLF